MREVPWVECDPGVLGTSAVQSVRSAESRYLTHVSIVRAALIRSGENEK